jgi:hypothetical protein
LVSFECSFASSEDIGLVVEDTAANVRPAAAAIAVGAKPKKRTSTAGRVSRSATAFISAFSAKFGLRVIWLSAVRGLDGEHHDPSRLRSAGKRNPPSAIASHLVAASA